MYNRNVEIGEYVVRENEPGDHLFVSAAGEFEIIVNGNVLGTLPVGKAFGELAILYNCKRTASIRGLTCFTFLGTFCSDFFLESLHNFHIKIFQPFLFLHWNSYESPIPCVGVGSTSISTYNDAYWSPKNRGECKVFTVGPFTADTRRRFPL